MEEAADSSVTAPAKGSNLEDNHEGLDENNKKDKEHLTIHQTQDPPEEAADNFFTASDSRIIDEPEKEADSSGTISGIKVILGMIMEN